eukprot:gene8598-9513_t
MHRNQHQKSKGQRYSEITKQFAVSLYYHSQKAYDFARKILFLPHPSSLRNWCSSVECKPGFLSNVIDELKGKLEKGEISREVSIVIDGMSIRKQTVWDTKEQRFMGFIDYGNNAVVESSEELASEALVFMVVGATGVSWKSIIAYFLCNKVNSGVLAQLTRTALNFLADAGFVILSIVWDGTFVNQEAARCLGCQFGASYDSLSTAFPHPTHGYLVHIIFDICHMLKLLRNTLADWKEFKIMYEKKQQCVQWKYLEELNSLQEKEGFTLANKLSPTHIQWHMHKMNVRLAAQTFSSSISNALDFLREDLKVDEFNGSEATTYFINAIDRAFDILNSRTPRAKGYKAPLRQSTLGMQENALISTANLLLGVKTTAGTPMIKSKRKTGIKASLKANCLQYEEDAQTPIFTLKWSKRHSPLKELNIFESDNTELLPRDSITGAGSLTPVAENVLYYMSGYVVRKIGSAITCSKCVLALLQSSPRALEDHGYCIMDAGCKLTIRKNKGGLIFASNGVFEIIKTCEQLFCIHVLNKNSKITSEEGICKKLIVLCARQLAWKIDKLFPNLERSCLEPEDPATAGSHAIQIIKEVAKRYLTLRLQTYAKLYNRVVINKSKASVRHKMTKAILFKNQ